VAAGDPPPRPSGKTGKSRTAGSSGARLASTKDGATYHRVKKGETLSSIAQSYNTTVTSLRKNNSNLSANLRAGEVLVIRK